MSMLLTFMLSMLLAITRAHHKGLKGPAYWSVGNLVVGLGMILVLMQLDSAQVLFLPGAALIGAGLSLYINGIQAFLGQKPNHRIPAAVLVLLTLVDVYFLLVQHDIRTTVVIDALVFMLIYLTCARLTFIEDEGVLGHLYWITSTLFLLLAMLMLVRIVLAYTVDVSVFGSFATWSINAYTFMIGAVSQFFISTLFVLMLSYQLNKNLASMLTIDGLTNVLNRRGLEDAALKMQAIAKRIHLTMSAMLLDIDHFKQVNDQYGHLVGDDALRHVASLITENLRTGDVMGRYGGEEFVVFMLNTNENEAAVLAERIRAAIEANPFKNHLITARATISIGVTDSTLAGYDFRDLIATADSTLYAAKKSGRNRVMCYTQVKVA